MNTLLVLYASKVIMISHLLLLVSCFDHLPQPLSPYQVRKLSEFHSFVSLFWLIEIFYIIFPSQDKLFEENSRLGSTPPSCHNKCNECHPCMAVQVPTLPGNDPVRPGLTRTNPMVYIDPSLQGNRYSNYKPLGWKCQCRDHFYNP